MILIDYGVGVKFFKLSDGYIYHLWDDGTIIIQENTRNRVIQFDDYDKAFKMLKSIDNILNNEGVRDA